MFRRKEEETATDTAATEASTETKNTENKESSTVTEAKDTKTEAPATAAKETEAKVAPLAQPAAPSNFRPAAAPAPAARPAAAAPMAAANQGTAAKDNKKRILTVGNDILLKGEIATCDRLVIEGAVDAKLKDVHTVEIAENGSFKGGAEIEDAEISGLFEGDLVVRNRLVIYSTGKVRGKITYGEIEIERGGELTGEIKIAGAAAPAAKSKAA